MFDINNYTEKTKTITITDPNQIITLGDDYNGGQYVDCFSATGLKITKDGVTLFNGKNYTLPTADKQLKEYYGQNFYSQIQMIGVTGTIVISYRCYGKYTDDNIINRHETRLNGHDTTIASVETDLTNTKNTVSTFDSRVTTIESNVEAAQSSISDIDSRLTLAEADIDTAQTNIASLQDNSLQKTDNSFGGLTVSTPTDGAKFVYQDETTGAILTCAKSALTASSGVGSGDVLSDVSASTVGNIVTISGTNGKHVTDSGVALSDTAKMFSVRSTTYGEVMLNYGNATGDMIVSSKYPLFYPGELKWFDDYIDSSDKFPFLCLADADKVLSASNWSLLVPHLRNKPLRYMPGTASAQTAFNVTYYSITSNVVTLTFANLTPEIKIISALAEDNLVHGSFSNWRTITLPNTIGTITAGTYAITAISSSNRTVSFAFTASNVSSTSVTSTAVFYPHRLPDSIDTTGSQARHFQMNGRSLVSINDANGECIGGLRRRDRFESHSHYYWPIYGSTAVQGAGLVVLSTGEGTTGTVYGPKTDGTYDLRTGKTTDPRSLIAVPYICGGSYNA